MKVSLFLLLLYQIIYIDFFYKLLKLLYFMHQVNFILKLYLNFITLKVYKTCYNLKLQYKI